MRRIGVIGGAAWPSTIEYYRLICDGANAHFAAAGEVSPLPTPPMTIESVNIAETRALRGVQGDEASWEAYDSVIRDALLRLEAAGCDFAIMANNTFHTRLASLKRGLSMEVLSILDVTADAARAAGAEKALVLGTSVTMQSDEYARVLATRGVEANARLDDDVIDRMQAAIDAEFYGAEATAEGRGVLLDICRAHAADGAVVLLACTELPLAFPEHAGEAVFESDGFTFVNTTAAHAAAALARSLAA